MDRIPEYPVPRLIERSLDLVFPPVCVGCHRVGRWICSRCWPEAPWSLSTACQRCGRPTVYTLCRACATREPVVREIRCVMAHDGVGREAVITLKFKGLHAISALMGRLMATAAQDLKADVVIPVPLHASRRRERGFDQARMLATVVAKDLGIPMRTEVLKRTRRTEQQALLDAARREVNVRGAFSVARPLDGENVLLVDDVFTTGATIEAAATPLTDCGAGTITGLVFTRAQGGSI